ncbi:hypothetical protein BC936DRAFT_136598 [Jimgerdemannia flammicorona]|uniref:G-patch domain-containing protein n=1 Tax=Jimgerdemannia flammicorona TaxID=994334 RepID=A0A433DJI4_9FUNG|nr:hypothetical protein BC936DRAFT_136598 [Jimgerdemannia flammicorona]
MYKPFSTQVPANKTPAAKPAPSKVPNQFVSDGSFMEQFLKQQQHLPPPIKQPKSDPSPPPPSTTTSTVPSAPSTTAASTPKPSTSTESSKSLSFALKKTALKPAAKPVKNKTFKDDEEDDEGRPAAKKIKSAVTADGDQSVAASSLSLESLRAKLDEEVVEVIDKFAEYANQHGESFVNVTKEKSRDNPKFSFLFDESSVSHKYYVAKIFDLAARDALLAEQQILQQTMTASQASSTSSFSMPHTSSVHYHPPMPESIAVLPATASAGASVSPTQAGDANDLKRKRSRWGQMPPGMQQAQQPQTSPTNSNSSFGSPTSTSSSSSSTRQVYSLSYTPPSSYASSPAPSYRGLSTSSNSTPLAGDRNRSVSGLPAPQPVRQFKKYSDMYKPGMIRVGSKWVYPEDEITEGGTWEHRKRAQEMKKTAGMCSHLLSLAHGSVLPFCDQECREIEPPEGKKKCSLQSLNNVISSSFRLLEQAATLTAHAQTKRAHHIADYLPKNELERFEAKVGAVKSGGSEPDFEDYADNKLNESNKGFEMLMKQGWKVGTGLGKEGAGVTAPVNKYVAPSLSSPPQLETIPPLLAEVIPEKAGLGQEKPDGVSEGDDEFEIYRKRMMLAYRFRPNPLATSAIKASFLSFLRDYRFARGIVLDVFIPLSDSRVGSLDIMFVNQGDFHFG